MRNLPEPSMTTPDGLEPEDDATLRIRPFSIPTVMPGRRVAVSASTIETFSMNSVPAAGGASGRPLRPENARGERAGRENERDGEKNERPLEKAPHH